MRSLFAYILVYECRLLSCLYGVSDTNTLQYGADGKVGQGLFFKVTRDRVDVQPCRMRL